MDFKAANLPGEIISIEAFSHAIECIYDCALDPVLWTRAIDAISLAAPRQRDRIGQLAVSGHETEGAVADRDIAVVRLLAPHIRRAIAIRDALDMHTMTISTFEATLDLIGPGVVLVDRDAKIIYANRAARSMLAAGSPIRSKRGAVHACRPQTSAALRAAIANAADGEATIGRTGIGLPAPQADGEPALIYMLPLMRGDIRGRIAPHAAAALFVTVKDGGASSFAEAIAAMFGLSAAEERTLERLLAGDTLAQAADTLGIAVTTVRTHLTHIFDKTGASRQAELIRLAAKFSPPCR
ncbi:MAG TPA: LuxR C-terminal-related transcriptional regulator [Xanthobacteraceae bacterium]|nr:LuxR C-terminal-related transcriptional regulator [Xanthobacteraceae bacterium]